MNTCDNCKYWRPVSKMIDTADDFAQRGYGQCNLIHDDWPGRPLQQITAFLTGNSTLLTKPDFGCSMFQQL